jgi:hypothetical protein
MKISITVTQVQAVYCLEDFFFLIGNRLLGSCTVYFWLELTFRRNVSPPSSGQVNCNENIVSRCLQMVGSQECSTYIVSWQGGAGEWDLVGEVGFKWTANQVLIGMWEGGDTCSLYSHHDSPALMMEVIHSSEMSVLTKNTRRKILEDSFLHSHRRENLKSYIFFLIC